MFPFSLPRCKEMSKSVHSGKIGRDNIRERKKKKRENPSKKTPAVNAQFKQTKAVINYLTSTL